MSLFSNWPLNERPILRSAEHLHQNFKLNCKRRIRDFRAVLTSFRDWVPIALSQVREPKQRRGAGSAVYIVGFFFSWIFAKASIWDQIDYTEFSVLKGFLCLTAVYTILLTTVSRFGLSNFITAGGCMPCRWHTVEGGPLGWDSAPCCARGMNFPHLLGSITATYNPSPPWAVPAMHTPTLPAIQATERETTVRVAHELPAWPAWPRLSEDIENPTSII